MGSQGFIASLNIAYSCDYIYPIQLVKLVKSQKLEHTGDQLGTGILWAWCLVECILQLSLYLPNLTGEISKKSKELENTGGQLITGILWACCLVECSLQLSL